MALTSPASAAVVVGSGDAGTAYVFDFGGLVNGNTEAGLSALLTLTFTGTSNGGATYNFNYNLLNDSTLSSRVSGFGFNTDPNVTGGSVSGTYNVVASGNLPQFGDLDICFKDGGGTANCGGGGSGGIDKGATGSGTLSLNFGSARDSVMLDDFTTRYQSIVGSNYGNSGIGIGTEVPAVPEPSTWALMLLGFGAVGWGLRRRKPADDQPRMRVLYN
jgi:hypothetical protein